MQRGFSLVETIVATSLVAVALVALAQFVGVGVQSGAAARARAATTLMAEQKMEQYARSRGGDRCHAPERTDYLDAAGNERCAVQVRRAAMRCMSTMVGEAGGFPTVCSSSKSTCISKERAWQHDARDCQSAHDAIERRRRPRFSFVELVVSMAIMLAVASSMFSFVHSARHVSRSISSAPTCSSARGWRWTRSSETCYGSAGLQVPAIAPFRRGDTNPDPPGSRFPDRISIRYVPADAAAGGAVTITYALDADAFGVPQLTRYDGHASDLPVVDQIAGLRFEYFDAAGQPIPAERFADGPWVPDAVAADRFDADLQSIRRVRALVRVRPARTFVGVPLADLEAAIDVSPRNLNLP